MRKRTTLSILIFLMLVAPFVLAVNYPSVYPSVLSEPSLSNSFTVTTTPEESWNQKESWSQNQICEFVKGCLDKEEEICYQFGYVKDNQYCGFDDNHYQKFKIKRSNFVNQSEPGEMCSYDFECKSNFCFNGECVGNFQTLIKDVLLRISSIEEKLGLVKVEVENLAQEKEIGSEIEELPIVENQIEENKESLFNNFKSLFMKR